MGRRAKLIICIRRCAFLRTNTLGLLLRADVHLLYDSGLLTVDPDGLRVVTSRRLAALEYSELDGARLELPREQRFEPNRDYLAVKFKEFEMMDRAS